MVIDMEKKAKRKKGLTLIELLAVIVIIAIITIISIPIINGVIEKSKKAAVKDSVYGLFDAVTLYHATHTTSGNLVFTCDGIDCNTADGDKLSFKGEVPTSGQIIFKNRKEIEAYYLKINKYCVLGNLETLDVQEDCSKLDITKPSLAVEKLSQTAKSVAVRVNASDIESGIKSITYKINDQTIVDTYNESSVTTDKVISGLSANNTTDLKVIVTNGNDLTEEKVISVTTNPITLVLKLNKTPTEGVDGYYKSVEAYMDYGTEEITGYYVKSTREGISNVEFTKSCGADTVPGECSSITNTTSISAGTWYYTENEPRITYNKTSTSTDTLYARITNGVSNINASVTIPKIDKTAPSVSLGDGNVTSKSISIPITSSDNESGLNTVTCKYSTTSGSYTETSDVTATTSNCTISNINDDTAYYYQVCIKDKLNNETCKTDSSETSALTTTLSSVKTPQNAVNGYYASETWSVNTTGDPIGYFVKSTKNGTSSAGLTKTCGTNTIPGECSDIASTTNISANTWYYTENKPQITYSNTSTSNETLYVRITDGKNTTMSATGTTVKIDKEPPSVSLGTATSTNTSISIPITSRDNESGLGITTCKYSTTSESYTEISGVTATTSNCTISGINADTTHYYQVCIKDGLNNETCKTGSKATRKYDATEVTYTNSKSRNNCQTVKCALDELYERTS